MSESLKLLNLNISCSIPWDEKKGLLKEVVLEENPDILCLQEVAYDVHEDTENRTQINKIAEMFGAKAFYASLTHPYTRAEDGRYLLYHGPGIVILNNDIEVQGFETVEIYRGDDGHVGEDRTFNNVAARLSIDGQDFIAMSLHFSAGNRVDEAAKTLEWIDDNAASTPLIIAGDLNSFDASSGNGDGDVDTEFRKKLEDAWLELRQGAPGMTYFGTKWWSDNHPDSATTKKLLGKGVEFADGRLDYVFYRGLNPRAIEQSTAGIPDLTDHTALSFEFSL